MTPWIWLFLILLVLFAAAAVKILRTTEFHGEGIPRTAAAPLDYRHTILSIIFYPIGFVTFVFTVLTLTPLVFIFHPKHVHSAIRFYGRLMLLSFGVIVKLNGQENLKRDKAFLLLINHESLFDVFLMACLTFRQVTALGAAYQFKLPLWGIMLKRYGIIPLKRSKVSEAIHAVEMAKEKLEEGICVFIAPEGTRTDTGELKPFKKGPFHLALGAEADILIAVFKGAFEIKRKTDWRIRPGKVTIDVGDFILFDDYKNSSIEELQSLVRARMLELLGKSESEEMEATP
ncbi:MAG: lysophospholipid acyltransferase family protein [Candidatus Neomarinimicrobiota bacterium]|nr:lysophospholipid acyltransferase family protein [Candidatus Neomarinimicrobiota bacterium]